MINGLPKLTQFTDFFSSAMKAVAIRFKSAPIASSEDLVDFVHTRSSYISQTALYGYLKARMGTRYRMLFEDPVFSQAMRASAVKIFLSCLSDLTIYTVARANRSGALSVAEADSLARFCFDSAAERALIDTPNEMIPADARSVFDARLARTNWAAHAVGLAAFKPSEIDLVLHAPVIDEFKELDREIVENSIRLRWADVREQFLKRQKPDSICAEWKMKLSMEEPMRE